jgi:hypothetical protein
LDAVFPPDFGYLPTLLRNHLEGIKVWNFKIGGFTIIE